MIRNQIALMPVGGVKKSVGEYIGKSIEEAMPRACHLIKGRPLPADAFNAKRKQYAARTILQRLMVPVGAERVIGVVDEDLFAPGSDFVFGDAEESTRRAVIGLARLRDEDESVFLSRAAKVALHQLGRTYGLEICTTPHCAMTYAKTIAELDNRHEEFCPKCKRRIFGSGFLRR